MSAGVRPRVALGVGAATLLALAGLGGLVAGGERSPEPRRAPPAAPAPHGVDADPGRSAGIRLSGRLLEASARPSRSATAAPPQALAESAPRPEPELRSGELVGLEREAARHAEAAALLDPDAVEASLASVPRLPGEAEAAFQRRLEDERERLLSREFLLQFRLAQLFASTEYPPGFDLERDVVAPERQRVAELPAGDRLIEIQNALESWEPGRASPRFGGAPDPTLAWQIGRPEL